MGRINLASERIGVIGKNKYGTKMEVIEYKGVSDILVKFEHGEITRTSWQNFNKGSVRSLYDKSVYGVGYLGEGSYLSKVNGEITYQYEAWRGMLRRCYSKKDKSKFPTYQKVEVDPSWLNFQIFAQWYDRNYYEIDDEKMTIDKDILVKGNKLYSPDTCIFVPQRINKLFTKCDASRGNLPIGVSWHKQYKKYSAVCDGQHLSWHDKPEESFKAYKIHKENLIRQVAEEYRNKIPNKLYEALINYKVEITD